MNSSPINNELNALISLLDEPDEDTLHQIHDKIYSYGIEAIPFLESAWEKAINKLQQTNIENLIHKIQFDNVYMELNNWLHFGSKNLQLGYILLSKYQYPELDEEFIKKQIDIIAKDVWLELNDNLTALEKIKVFNHIFYDIHGFSGNTVNYYSPQSSYLNTFLENKKGNSLSLGMLYIIIAQKNNLPVYGVNLPEHFILAYTNQILQDNLTPTNDDEILFYINPFNKGTVFSKQELENFTKQLKLKYNYDLFSPCENDDIIKRMIFNLIYAYEKTGDTTKIKELDIILKLFL